MPNKRRFNRIPLNVMAEIIIDDKRLLANEIRNLSLGGCMLPLRADFETKTPCRIHIYMNGDNSELKVFVTGRVMFAAADFRAQFKIKVRWRQPAHLQAVVEVMITQEGLVR